MERLAGRARDLALIDPSVEDRESPWRATMAAERLADLRRFTSGGRLVEIGSSTGEFLLAARDHFEVMGIEADLNTSALARSRGLVIHNGAIVDAALPARSLDVVVLYHVIEHLRQPRRDLCEVARLLRPGGWLAVETPDIDSLWFRLLGARWRQIIPDHIFFFSAATLTRLLTESGFEVLQAGHVGKSMSLRLFISRVGRYSTLAASLISALARGLGVEDHTLRLNLGDVIRLYARRRPS